MDDPLKVRSSGPERHIALDAIATQAPAVGQAPLDAVHETSLVGGADRGVPFALKRGGRGGSVLMDGQPLKDSTRTVP